MAAAYFICAIAYGPYYCLSFLRVNGWRVAVTVSLFWLPILLGVSNICTHTAIVLPPLPFLRFAIKCVESTLRFSAAEFWQTRTSIR